MGKKRRKKKKGTFKGEPDRFHIHIVGGTAHYKYRNGKRCELMSSGAYDLAKLYKALTQCELDRSRMNEDPDRASYEIVKNFLTDRIAELEGSDSEPDEMVPTAAASSAPVATVVPDDGEDSDSDSFGDDDFM